MTIFLMNQEVSSDGMVDDSIPKNQQKHLTRRQLHMLRNVGNRHRYTAISAEQAGPYATLLTTSFMIGRTCTAHFWGRLADCYGRRFVLLASLIGSGLACLWFGMTTIYGGLCGAVMSRGMLGAWNSIVGVTKTLATELAYFEFDENPQCKEGTKENITTVDTPEETIEETSLKVFFSSNDQGPLSDQYTAPSLGEGSKNIDNIQEEPQQKQQHQETRIVGLVVGMRAWGYLIAPAIAGFLADPLMVRIHGIDAETNTLRSNIFHRVLQWYPYLLPNLLGLILCWITAAAVFVGIPETLNDCREFHLVVTDFRHWSSNLFKCGFGNSIVNRFWKVLTKDQTPSKIETNVDRCTLSDGHQRRANPHESSPFAKAEVVVDYGSYVDDQKFFAAGSRLSVKSSFNQTTEDFKTKGDDPASNSGLNTENCWAKKDDDLQQQTSLRSIWQRTDTRYHLIAYWLYSFIVICIDEAFPLYCISSHNGFVTRMSESDIGIILSLSGILFALVQFRFYKWIVGRFGIYGSLGMGCWWGVLPTTFIPFASLFLISDASPTISSNGNDHGVGNSNKRYSMIYLSLLMGVTKLYQSAFFSSITIATNRTVSKEVRSSMNGFASVGAGAAKAIGPLMAGYWMALCLSFGIEGEDETANNAEGINHSVPLRALVAFTGIGSLGVATSAFLRLLRT